MTLCYVMFVHKDIVVYHFLYYLQKSSLEEVEQQIDDIQKKLDDAKSS